MTKQETHITDKLLIFITNISWSQDKHNFGENIDFNVIDVKIAIRSLRFHLHAHRKLVVSIPPVSVNICIHQF